MPTITIRGKDYDLDDPNRPLTEKEEIFETWHRRLGDRMFEPDNARMVAAMMKNAEDGVVQGTSVDGT